MASVSSNFTAVSQATASLSLRNNTYAGLNVSVSGVFVGTVVIQRQLPGDAAATWRTMGAGYTVPTETTLVVDGEAGTAYRAFCSAYTSGTATVRLGQSV